jgi:hypothetical protein
MRTSTQTVTFYSPGENSAFIWNGTKEQASQSVQSEVRGDRNFSLLAAKIGSDDLGDLIGIHATADARLT